jgi:hypothetical protein
MVLVALNKIPLAQTFLRDLTLVHASKQIRYRREELQLPPS